MAIGSSSASLSVPGPVAASGVSWSVGLGRVLFGCFTRFIITRADSAEAAQDKYTRILLSSLLLLSLAQVWEAVSNSWMFVTISTIVVAVLVALCMVYGGKAGPGETRIWPDLDRNRGNAAAHAAFGGVEALFFAQLDGEQRWWRIGLLGATTGYVLMDFFCLKEQRLTCRGRGSFYRFLFCFTVALVLCGVFALHNLVLGALSALHAAYRLIMACRVIVKLQHDDWNTEEDEAWSKRWNGICAWGVDDMFVEAFSAH